MTDGIEANHVYASATGEYTHVVGSVCRNRAHQKTYVFALCGAQIKVTGDSLGHCTEVEPTCSRCASAAYRCKWKVCEVYGTGRACNVEYRRKVVDGVWTVYFDHYFWRAKKTLNDGKVKFLARGDLAKRRFDFPRNACAAVDKMIRLGREHFVGAP